MKRISARTLYAKVDDEDFDRLNAYTWTIMGSGYVSGGPGHHVLMHHMLIQQKPGFEVDHINGDKLDNQKHNLRLATRAQNSMNCKLQVNNTTGFRGVCERGYRRSPFEARIGSRSLGSFKTAEEAARVYDKTAQQLYGEYARLNFPDERIVC